MKDFASLSDAELMAAYKAAKDPFGAALEAEGVSGQLADIAILSHDIFAIEPETVEKDVRCDMTILGGKVVFDREGQLATAAE